MGEQSGKALWARASFLKSAIVIAPLAVAALFIATGTSAQTSGSVAPSVSTSANGPVVPIPSPEAARSKGPKIRDKVPMDTSRSANPTPAEPTTSTPVAPIDAPDGARRGGPKGGGRDKEDTGRTATPAVDVTPAEGRRKGPKGRSGSDHDGRTEATPAPDTAPVEGRRKGPKGAGESGRTEAPAPDTQPTGRRKEGPKGDHDHGRTSTTPLIIGALSAAAVLALVISSGNDRPASP